MRRATDPENIEKCSLVNVTNLRLNAHYKKLYSVYLLTGVRLRSIELRICTPTPAISRMENLVNFYLGQYYNTDIIPQN